jgi:hypothetical protein
MRKETKMVWLKWVLLVKIILTLCVWGLPALVANAQLLSVFNLTTPADPIYLRLFGAACTAFGIAYWFAYLDPV